MSNIKSVSEHYDMLIDENNDPVYDPIPLKEYMDKWDGTVFFDELAIEKFHNVLEIGVGTGRLAIKAAPMCKMFLGIDISPKTAERAKNNLSCFSNAEIVCADFLTHRFTQKFDIIYSSLTFMHFRYKKSAVCKAAELLVPNGKFVLSIDKNSENFICYGDRRIRVYPDSKENTKELLHSAGLFTAKILETEHAYIFTAIKTKEKT